MTLKLTKYNKSADGNDIPRQYLKSIIASKSKVKRFKGHNPQKAHLHPLRDVCMQYKNNLKNAFGDFVRKPNLSSAIN